MIEAGLVDLEQVFLPYAQNQGGQTVYDVMSSQRFSSLAPGASEDRLARWMQPQTWAPKLTPAISAARAASISDAFKVLALEEFWPSLAIFSFEGRPGRSGS